MIKRVLVLRGRWLVLCLCFVALSGCSDPLVESQELKEKGQQYIANNDLRAAAIELKNALQLDPNNAEARFLLGKVSFTVSDFEAAQKELNHAKSLGFANEEVALLLAETMLKLQRYDDLLKELGLIDVSYSKSTQANLTAIRAIAHSALGKLELARRELDGAEHIDKQAHWVLVVRINQAMADGHTTQANSLIQAALDTYPKSQTIWLLKASVSEAAGDKESIKLALNKVIELDPPSIISALGWQARMGLVKLAIANKEFDVAEKALKPLASMSPNHPEANYFAGLLAFQKENKELAEQKLLQVLKVLPNHAPTQLLLGTIHYQGRKLEQAAHYLSAYIAAVPVNNNARKLLAQTYIALGRSTEAQALLRDTAADGAIDSEMVALIGISELIGGDSAEGIKNLGKAVDAAPENVQLRFTLARAYAAEGKTKEAVAELNKLIDHPEVGKAAKMLRILAYVGGRDFATALSFSQALRQENPDDAGVIALMANVYLASNDVTNGRKALTEAIALKPDYVKAIMDLASVDEREEKYDQAKANYQRVLEIQPNAAEVMIALARISGRTRDTEGVGQWLEKAYAAAPAQLLPQVLLAEHYLGQNQISQADVIVKQLLENNGQHSSTLSLQGRLFMLKQQYNQAVKPFQDLIQSAPDVAVHHRLLGEVWLALKEYDKAASSFERVLALEPDNIVALNNAAWLYGRNNDPRALKYAEKVYGLDSKNPAIQDTLGWILINTRGGDIERGHSLLQKAAEALPNMPEVTYHLAVAKIKRGESAEGKAMLKKLLDSGQEFDGRQEALKY